MGCCAECVKLYLISTSFAVTFSIELECVRGYVGGAKKCVI